jgi:hypothetical protein
MQEGKVRQATVNKKAAPVGAAFLLTVAWQSVVK